MENVRGLIEKVKADIQDGKPDEEIFQSLLPLFGKDRDFDGQLAESLANIPDVKIAKVLQKMLQVCNEKRVRKNIKRSLYRLKSKGIAVEEIPPRREESILRPLQAEPPKGFGGGFDFLGQRFPFGFDHPAADPLSRGIQAHAGQIGMSRGQIRREYTGGLPGSSYGINTGLDDLFGSIFNSPDDRTGGQVG